MKRRTVWALSGESTIEGKAVHVVWPRPNMSKEQCQRQLDISLLPGWSVERVLLLK